MELGAKTIDMMVKGKDIEIPRYDKSAYEGKGDRAKKEDWIKMEGPLDLVIVEGWMLGFQPIKESNKSIDSQPGMDIVNQYLEDYSVWEEKLDAAILVSVEDSKIIFDWREQPEKERRDAGEGAMTELEVRSFCSRFLPSYDAYCPRLSSEGMPEHVDSSRTLNFRLSEDRVPYVTHMPHM